jgi:cold-inducible RNA-binding protein
LFRLLSSTFPVSRLQINKGIAVKNIYVGNLSFGASEESVRALFETHGVVGRVNLVMDRESGQPRGFGFVEMANDGEGEKAIAAINGTEFEGRTLSVNEGRPKTNLSTGGGVGRKRW